MNKINKLSALLMLCLVFVGFAACSEDDLNTNQYQKGVALSAYGPQPVVRGGTLRFLGSNLDQVKEVRIPGVDPITAIDVRQAGVPSEIHVQIPKDGPEEGFVTLVTNTGLEITTKTKLTYEESIEFESFAPASVMPGETLTIKGDYLNLIHQVLFVTEAGNATTVAVEEEDFKVHTRYEIQLPVPAEACTGKIVLSDGDEEMPNWVYADEALIVGTPVISGFASPRGEAEAAATVVAKMGETITVSGSSLSLIASLKFGDEEQVFESEVFEVNEDGTMLTFGLPEEAPDGDFSIVCRSGVIIPVGQIETVAPSNAVAAPAPVKAGQTLTVTGNDMDVVVSVEMPNVSESEEIAITKATDGTKVEITAVPATAQEGNMVLRMKNGKGIEVPFTLVKPVVTEYDHATVSAGASLVMKGTDLDLVKTVQFGENSDLIEISSENATTTSIQLTVPMNAVSGEPLLGLANGTTVAGAAITIDEAVFCYITQLPGEEDELKAGATMSVSVMNADKLTTVKINNVECQYIITGENKDQLIVGIPESAGASSRLQLISSNGEIEYTIAVIPATSVKKVVWTGLTTITWGDGGRVIVPASAFEGVPSGAVLTVCYAQADQTWAQAQFNYGDWSGINFDAESDDFEGEVKFSQTLVPTDIYGWFEDGILNRETSMVLTQDILDNIQSKQGECEGQTGCGIIIQGSDLTFSKIMLQWENELETTIWDLGWDCSGWGGNQDLAWGGYDWSTVKANAMVRFYYTKIKPAEWGCISLRHGDSWGGLPEPIPGQYDLAEDEGVLEVQFPKNVLDDIIANGGLVITGDNYRLRKVTIE